MPLDFDDRTDFENADRGLIDTLDPCVVKDADGQVVWDMEAYAFLDGECPDTVNPSLWRQAQLCAKQGLFEVTDGIYQVRGLDLSNMTIVEGDTGVIVDRPADLGRDRRGRAGALPRAPRRPAGDGGDLHPLARRPLRRRARACCPTAPATSRSSPRTASWSTPSRRTSTPARR